MFPSRPRGLVHLPHGPLLAAEQRAWLVKHSLCVAQRLPPLVSPAKLLFVSAWTRREALLHLSFIFCCSFLFFFFCFPYLFFARPARCCNKHEVIYVLVLRQKMEAQCSGKWREKAEVCVCVCWGGRWMDQAQETHPLFILHQPVLDGLFQSSLTRRQMSGYGSKGVKGSTLRPSLASAGFFKIPSETCLRRPIILTKSRITYLLSVRIVRVAVAAFPLVFIPFAALPPLVGSKCRLKAIYCAAKDRQD